MRSLGHPTPHLSCSLGRSSVKWWTSPNPPTSSYSSFSTSRSVSASCPGYRCGRRYCSSSRSWSMDSYSRIGNRCSCSTGWIFGIGSRCRCMRSHQIILGQSYQTAFRATDTSMDGWSRASPQRCWSHPASSWIHIELDLFRECFVVTLCSTPF